MSTTFPVNSNDCANGSQAAVCQSAAQHNYGKCNGGVGDGNGIDIGVDDDDMGIFDHENMERRHVQLGEDCRDLLNQKDKECCYNFSDLFINRELNEKNEVQKWNFLMSYIRNVYHKAMDGIEVERYPVHHLLKEVAHGSKSYDSYHVLQNVEDLVMEFVLEARSRQVQILEKKNKDTPEMPQVFLFCLLDSYQSLMAATDHLKDVIKPIEEYHLSKFNLTWRMMNQYLYHSRLYADRTINHLVTTFVEKFASKPILSKSLLIAGIIQDHTKYIQEVQLSISEWTEAKTCIHNKEGWDILISMLKEVNGLLSSSMPPNNDLVIDLTIPTPPQLSAPEYHERVDNDNCEDLDDDGVSNYCDGIRTLETWKNSSVDFDQCVQNEKSTNLQENEDIHSISFSYSNMKEKMLCFYRRQTFTDEGEKSVTGNITANIATNLRKKVLNSDAQIKSKPVVNVKCPSTIDRNVTCKVEIEQLPKIRSPYPHVKSMYHRDETSECSSGRSSRDDSGSERSSSSRRPCADCNCKVFEHAASSVATGRRKYQETKDRLRNLYLSKKAKQTNETIKQKQKEPNVHIPLPVHPLKHVPPSVTDKTGAIIIAQQKKIEPIVVTKVINEKLKYNSENLPENFLKELSEKPIDEIVNFIESNKSTNQKRAAKKARRQEKKEEIERIKKEGAEFKKIEEVLKKQEIERLKREEVLKKKKEKGKNQNKQQKQSQQQIVNFIEGNNITNEKRAAKKARLREKKEDIEIIKKEEEAERTRIEEVLKKQEIETLKSEEALRKEKKKRKNQNKQQKQSQQQKPVTNSKSHQITKQQVQYFTQPSKKKIKQSHGNSYKETVSIKKDDKCKKDDVVCNLYDNEAITEIQRLCDKSKQPQNIIEDEPNKNRSMNRKNKQPETQLHSKPVESVLITNKKNTPKLPKNMKCYGYDYEGSTESVFEPKDLDNGEMDDDERELEEFKRFCLRSVPLQRKEKVHLNIKDIVLKKKSTAAAAAAAVGSV